LSPELSDFYNIGDNLKDKDVAVRKSFAEATGKLGFNAKDAVCALIAALNDKDELMMKRCA
jgi:HEAT repeat protein